MWLNKIKHWGGELQTFRFRLKLKKTILSRVLLESNYVLSPTRVWHLNLAQLDSEGQKYFQKILIQKYWYKSAFLPRWPSVGLLELCLYGSKLAGVGWVFALLSHCNKMKSQLYLHQFISFSLTSLHKMQAINQEDERVMGSLGTSCLVPSSDETDLSFPSLLKWWQSD